MPIPSHDPRWKTGAKRTWTYDRAEVNRRLRSLNDPKESALERAHHGGYLKYRLEIVPISKINVPAMWHQNRPGPIRERMSKNLPLDPVRLSVDGHRYNIEDGIHRTNVAIEFGFTHVPAIISEWIETPADFVPPVPEKPRLDLNSWVRLHTPDGGREYGWISERLGPHLDRGVNRWLYNIALVRPGDDWPDFVDLKDIAFEPVSPPPWGEALRTTIKNPR